jgi:membrane dipeptidase
MRRISELTKDERDHALELYGESIVIDCHLDSVLTDDYVGRMLGSGVTAVNLDGGSLESIAEKHGVIERHPDVFVGPVTAVGEIRDAKEEGKIAVFLGAESAEELLDSREVELNLEKLSLLHRLGLRIVQPCYNDENVFADGCAEVDDRGLSSAGLELIDRMNGMDMIVDCSHVSYKTALDVCESADFVVSTHSNARSVCDNPRNRTDEEIQAIAEKGGVLGMVSFPTFVRWTDAKRGVWPGVQDLLDHVDYIDELVGVEHVGVGLDLVEGTDILGPIVRGEGLTRWPELYGDPGPDGFYRYARGLDSVEGLKNLAVGLVARGYSDGEVVGVLGGNWLRVFGNVWSG